ncbi:hypothetical protein BGZ95_005190 [Linnemannia exigua]|uniref:Uncharacterized protein n=1 Tax=Linnemannia exigua TaxID=604196 RepID=A0AAD4DLI8_9FUNG|nr:hypothetical protein BGZ95_005190 [Linnemannia exigua]
MANATQTFRLGPDGEQVQLEAFYDCNAEQQVIYWDDISREFPTVHRVKNGNTRVSFARNKQRQWCDPPCIRLYPGVVLEVVPGSHATLDSSSLVNASLAEASEHDSIEDNASRLNLEPLAIVDTVTAPSILSSTAVSPAVKDTALATAAPPSYHILQRTQLTLQKSSAQLVQYEQSTQAGQVIQADTFKRGMQTMQDIRGDILALRTEVAKNDELKELQQTILTLQAAADAQTKRMEEMHQQSVELQERSLRMQQSALDRLALIQNKVAAILTQNYELHEYPIPRLFIVLPKEGTTRTETLSRGVRNLFAKQFKLYFLCECGDHTKPVDGRAQNPNLKHEIHLARHEGYDIDRPTEFFEKYGSYILTLLQMLKYGVTIAGVIVPPLGQLKIIDDLKDTAEGIDHVLKDIGSRVNSSIAYIEGLSGVQSQLSLPDPNASSTDSTTLGGLGALEGADLRQLESFLNSSDEGRVLGNLYRIFTLEGHVKWVCLDHYRENYRAEAAQDLWDVVQEVGGQYNETTGHVDTYLDSPIAARRFYSVLGSSRSVQSLFIQFRWVPSMQDLRDLQDTIKLTNICSLQLGSTGSGPLLPDVLNFSRRSDPILQMMSGGKIRTCDLRYWRGFLDRINNIPTTLSIQQLTLELSHKSPKTILRLISILQASPLLTELTCWCSEVDLVLDPIMAALENNKRTLALKLDVYVNDVSGRVNDLSWTRVEIEAGTSRILSIDLRVNTLEGTMLLYHPSVRNIHFMYIQKLPILLDALRRCLQVNTGLESVNVSCSTTDHLCLRLPEFQGLFTKYPHQIPRFRLAIGESVFMTSNIQDVDTGHLKLAINNSDIAAGYLSNIPNSCTVKVRALNLDSETTSDNINALLRFLDARPVQPRFKILKISLNAHSSPIILASIHEALQKYRVLQDSYIRVELNDVASGPLFASAHKREWSLLQDYANCIDLFGKLPLPPQSTSMETLIWSCRRLKRLQLVELHPPTEQEFWWILAMIRRVYSCSSFPTNSKSIVEPTRLRELVLKNCHLSHVQWRQLVDAIDILTLGFVYIEDLEGFSGSLLTVLVDRCISTAKELSALAESSEIFQDPFAIENLRDREQKNFQIILLQTSVEDAHIMKEEARLKAHNIGWVKIK